MVDQAACSRFVPVVSCDSTLEKIADGHIFTERSVWNPRDKSLMYTAIIGDTIWNWKAGFGKRIIRHPWEKVNRLTFEKKGRPLMTGGIPESLIA